MTSRGFALGYLVLVALFDNGLSLKCHLCVSSQYKDCKDPFALGDTHLEDCHNKNTYEFNKLYLRETLLPAKMTDVADGEYFCAKIINDKNEYARTCLKGGNSVNKDAMCKIFLDEMKLHPTTAKWRFQNCTYCNDKDGCNGANASNAVFASLPVALVSLLVSYVCGKYL